MPALCELSLLSHPVARLSAAPGPLVDCLGSVGGTAFLGENGSRRGVYRARYLQASLLKKQRRNPHGDLDIDDVLALSRSSEWKASFGALDLHKTLSLKT